MLIAAPSLLDSTTVLTLAANAAQTVNVPTTQICKFVTVNVSGATYVTGNKTATTSNGVFLPQAGSYQFSLSGVNTVSVIATGSTTVSLTFGSQY
jgi:hypothetical protein